ncbi:hypothetical protein SAMN05428959_107166 [Duganella sp. CF517]|nr:hypothetical protein [Duganella sp. CF517]SEO39239.1 hypothetical protein SAMN05428959_107166 [Duganella sp. CF517]
MSRSTIPSPQVVHPSAGARASRAGFYGRVVAQLLRMLAQMAVR